MSQCREIQGSCPLCNMWIYAEQLAFFHSPPMFCIDLLIHCSVLGSVLGSVLFWESFDDSSDITKYLLWAGCWRNTEKDRAHTFKIWQPDKGDKHENRRGHSRIIRLSLRAVRPRRTQGRNAYFSLEMGGVVELKSFYQENDTQVETWKKGGYLSGRWGGEEEKVNSIAAEWAAW